MAICEVCGKSPQMGMSVSHSHIRTKKRWHPNLQKIRINDKGTVRRAYVCTTCIRSNRIAKA